jgi:hypothetical protein
MSGRNSIAALALAICAAGCAHHTSSSRVRPDEHVAATDSWLRGRSDADCQQPSCLFAILVDTAGNPVVGADPELSGSTVHVTSTGQGRVVAQGIPLGSHRVRVIQQGGETLESDPIPFGYTIKTLVMEIAHGSLRIRS